MRGRHMRVIDSLHHYGDQEVVRAAVIIEALRYKRWSQKNALTSHHPAARRYYELDETFTQAEAELVERLCPGSPIYGYD